MPSRQPAEMPGTRNSTPLSIGGSVKSFETWSNNRLQTLPVSVLKDSVLGVDGGNYLKKLLETHPTREPLVPALGGFPFSLRANVENDLEHWRQAGIKPLFIFSGIKVARNDKPFSIPDESPKIRSNAWQLYDNGHAAQAVEAFGESGNIPPNEVFRFVMKILQENNVEFFVSPYSSWAQLVYMEKHPKQLIDAIYGPVEVFFYEVEKVITGFNFSKGTFSCLNKKAIMQDLGGLNHDQFIDACILSGCDLCNTFPILDNSSGFLFKNSLDMLKSFRNVPAIVNQYFEAPTVRDSGYLDKYRRARCAIKFHVVMTDDGKVEAMNEGDAPSDVHEFIGQRLPEELYFYLSKGTIGPQVLDMLVSGEIVEVPPLDNGEGEEYRRFLDSLQPMRSQALSLLAQPLHRFWLNKQVNVIYWFDKNNPRKIAHKDLNPVPYDYVNAWNVKEATFGSKLTELKAEPNVSFAIRVLTETGFAAKSINPKDPENLLKTTDEIILNTIWRTLQLRSFVSADHTLTPWGKVLNAAMSALKPGDGLEEACYLGIELLRLKVIKTGDLRTYLGEDEDKKHCSLIARVASLAHLRHHNIGYTGPLSRNLLAFNSIIRAVTRTLKNLTEMVLASMLMNCDADRDDRNDWSKLGLSLPFTNEVNAALGIAVKTYLDELSNDANPLSEETKERVKEEIPRMFSQSVDVMSDIQLAFRLWDAIIIGVKQAQKDNLVPDSNKFIEADKWLAARR